MSNHFHLILRTRPDRARLWEPLEVATRWRTVFPKNRGPQVALEVEARDKKLIRE